MQAAARICDAVLLLLQPLRQHDEDWRLLLLTW
jgi:hypothetical protein